jgi:hypothetical protein
MFSTLSPVILRAQLWGRREARDKKKATEAAAASKKADKAAQAAAQD